MFQFGSLVGYIVQTVSVPKIERELMEWKLIKESKLGGLLYERKIQKPNEATDGNTKVDNDKHS